MGLTRLRIRGHVALAVGAAALVVTDAGAAAAYETITPASSALSASELTGEVSNARGQALRLELAGQDLPDVLQPAVVENDGGFRIVSVGSLDLGPLEDLGPQIGAADLLGEAGALVLGALNQYAEAGGEGFSYAAAGAVSDAGLVELPAVTSPEESGAIVAIGTETLGLGNLVGIRVDVGALASTAHWPADGPPEVTTVVSDVLIALGGDIVDDVAGQLDAVVIPVTDQLSVLGGLLGVDTGVENPLAEGELAITEDHLLEAAGVDDLADLPSGTDLLAYLADAVVAALNDVAEGIVAQIEAIVDDLRASPEFGTVCTPPLLPPNPLCALVDTVAATAAEALGDELDAILETVLATLDDTLPDLLALPVATQTEGEDGSLTVTALSAIIGPDGAAGTLDFATSTVGPNVTPGDGRSSAPS